MIDLTNLFNAVIALLAAIITAFVIPWIKAKATTQQQEALLGLYRTLCFAAEQLYGAGRGEEKLAYVEAKLMERGYTVDRDMIEATVKMHFGEWGKSTKVEELPAEEESEEDEDPQTRDEGGQSPTNESESVDSPSVASAEPGSVMAVQM